MQQRYKNPQALLTSQKHGHRTSPPQLQVYSDPYTCLVLIRPSHLCNVHYLESDHSPDHFRVVYYWYLITSGSHHCGGSTVMPIMSIYRLPLGQYGYTGHINLRSHICIFTPKTTIWGGRLDRTKGLSAVSQRLPHIRRSVVQDALTYLIETKYYRANATRLNQEALQQLLNNYYFITIHMTCQKLVSNYTRHWHPHSLRSPKWCLRHPSIVYGES